MNDKPFQEDKRFTQVHNYVFDSLMRALSPNAFKVLMFIIRNTKGMTDENGDRIKLAQLPYPKIKEGTGIVANATLSWALKELKLFDLIAIEEGKDYQANSYSINEAHTTKSENDLESTKSKYDAWRKSENDVPPTSENDGNKRNKELKKNDKEKQSAASAAAPVQPVLVESSPSPTESPPPEKIRQFPANPVRASRTPPSPDSAAPPSLPKRERPAPHPFVAAYVARYGWKLNRSQIAELSALPSDDELLARWDDALKAWSMVNNKPTNLVGLLDWFRHGIPQHAKPAVNGNVRAMPPRVVAGSEVDKAQQQPQWSESDDARIRRMIAESERGK